MQRSFLIGIMFVLIAPAMAAVPKAPSPAPSHKTTKWAPTMAGPCQHTLKPGTYNFKAFLITIPRGWAGTYHPASGGTWSVELRGPRKGQLVMASGFEKAKMKKGDAPAFVQRLRTELLPGAKKSFETRATVGGKPGLKLEATCPVGDNAITLRRLISDRPKFVYVLDEVAEKQDWAASQKDFAAIAGGFKIQ